MSFLIITVLRYFSRDLGLLVVFILGTHYIHQVGFVTDPPKGKLYMQDIHQVGFVTNLPKGKIVKAKIG